jgi:hypothetical protein
VVLDLLLLLAFGLGLVLGAVRVVLVVLCFVFRIVSVHVFRLGFFVVTGSVVTGGVAARSLVRASCRAEVGIRACRRVASRARRRS